MKTQKSWFALWLFTCLTLLVAPIASRAQATNFMVDDFAATGVGPTNPTNNDYYPWAANYSTSGAITNVWWLWFGSGTAFVTNNNAGIQWDATSDASNNLSSGSMKISLNWKTNSQFVIWDQGNTNNYFSIFNYTNFAFTNFECDVRFAAGSASDAGNTGGQPIFGHLRFGVRTDSYGQDWFGAVDIVATNTNWVHVSIPLNALADTNLSVISSILIGIDSQYYSLNLNGPSTLWVDNIKLVGTHITILPPTLAMQKTTPGLRIFAGAPTDIYGREQLASVDQNQSWVGGTYPVSYSFTLLSFPTVPDGSVFRFHIFLVPTNNSVSHGGTISFHNNQYVEYQVKNDLWLNVSGTNPTNVTAVIQWKTNAANSNPTNTALLITNSTAIGTWKLTFNSTNTGTLTAPGASPVAFSIPGAAAAQFTNKLVAFFGVQPDSGFGIGQYVDVSHIQTIGVKSPGVAINDDFTKDTTIKTAVWDVTDSSQQSSLVLVTTNTPYWAAWTLPDAGFEDGLCVVTNLAAKTNQWMLPEYYNNYSDGLYVPGASSQGAMKWLLIPSTCLPTVDNQPQSGQPLSPNAFFRLSNPPPDN